jgi:tRNA A-37 threonylcarbamoyl transferase component Bud32/uncharacterized RDD family membrane protein YckC
MNTIRLCPGCGAPLTGDAPGGLCPQCLLQTQVIGEEELAALPTARAMPVPGESFGDYRILKLLGHGGMGEVYEAEHVTTARRVALKVMRHTLASDQDRKRFLREGRLAASVNHPNVVYIHGSEEIAGAPAIAMELVHGGTLKDRLKREGPLPIPDAVEAALQVIDGLEAAHGAGVLHRDIKPANCFVSADGMVKVGDFGLSVSTLARGESLITASGSVMGTPAYASPEQLRGEELDVTSDIYSVGATLYHLLTGKTPFNATDFVKLITEVLDKQPVAPKTLRAEIPAELSKALLRCLEKERKERFQTYAELRDALLPFRGRDVVPGKPARRFLADCVDSIISYGPSLLFAAYWSFDPLQKFAQEQTLHWGLVWLPFFLWYALYRAVSEGVWGAGIGKALCGLRVVGRDGQAPGFARALVRVLVYMVPFTLPPFVLMAVMSAEDVRAVLDRGGFLFTDWVWIPLTVAWFITMRARNGYAALHDLVTRTRVIVRPKTQPRPALTSLTVTVATVESSGAPALKQFGPYEATASLWKSGNEELALAFDPALRRKVWIHLKRGEATSDARRDLSRAARLRWINGGQIEGRSWNAYEALEGAPFLAVAQRPQPWNAVRFWMLDLAEECVAALQFPETSPTLELNRLWITASGRAVLLEFLAPALNTSNTALSAKPLDGVNTMQQFLAEVSRVALEGSNTTSTRSESIRALTPLHARSFLDNIVRRTFEEARVIVGNLQSLIAKPAEVTRVGRAASLAFAPIIAVAVAALIIASMNSEHARWDRGWAAAYPGQPSLRIAEEIYAEEAEELAAGGDNAEEAKKAGTYLAAHFAHAATNEAFWRAQPALTFQNNMRKHLREALEKFPASDAQTIAQAERDMARRIAKRERKQSLSFIWVGVSIGLGVAVVAALVDLIGTLAFGIFPLLRLFGIRVVNRFGVPVSRLHLLGRWLVAWPPTMIAMAIVAGIARSITNGEFHLPIAVGVGIALALVLALDAVFIYAVLRPSAGLQDRLSRTRLVPL